MYSTFSSSYETDPTATMSYEEHKALVVSSIVDLTPSGKLFKLKGMLQQCKSIHLTTICKELLKELSNDTHLQPKP